MADYSSPPLQDGGELGQMASTTSASGRLLQSDCNVPDSLVSAASPSGHLLQMECKGPDPLVSAATHSGHILQTECRVADPLVSAATPSGHLLHMECDVPDPLVSATSPSGHLLQMECDVPDPLVSPTSPADHVLQTECKVPDPLVSAASPSGHLLQLECNVPDPLVSAASSSGHLLQMECDMPDPLVSAASPSAHLLQMECSVPDPVVSCHEFPNQGPALPKDLQEQGPVLPKDLGEQEEQTLPKGKPKHGPTLSLQTPVASAIHTMSLLQPDDLLVSEISSRLTTEVASFGLERTSVGEDAQATKSFPLDEALGKASDPLELHLPLTSDTSEKTFVGSELCKKILSSVTETSEVPGRSSAETDKSTDPIAATTEKLGSVVGATSHEKSIGIAGSELSVSVAKCVSVVSAQTDKPLVGAKSSEEYPSDSSLLSEQTPSNVVGQLQKSSAIDWVSTQPCLTLDTVEDSHLLKPFSLSEDELVSPLDSMKKSTSQPVASSDQSTLPPVSKDVISPLPSTKNSSSVITVDKKLPCSSSQSSENDKSTSVLPLQKDELPPGVSGSSGSQDIQECFQVRSKSHDNTCDTENGCELNLGADVSSEDKIVSEGLSCMNRMSEESEVVNSEQEMQADEPGECWNDVDSSREAAASGTLPLIVDTHTLSQADDEHSSVITNSVAHSNLISSSVLSSPQSGASNVDTVPLLETEPLQPVTIGSSLQPLEEVQEASVLDDPSFAADLALIDSSADEADSIGGLVINSVIGAADGVVDFHPDEEMETDRELTDISASAPQIVEGSCDNDSSDETGPSAKRMRFENGISDSEDKVQGTKKVIIKVTPVKNGHGLWDAHKLQEILLAKGTILLRLHASTDSYEMFEPDKDEKEVDFTGIIAEAKDEEHDHILGLANLEPDADVYDPLAIGATHASEHASPPHYNRPFPHSRGRSTALQPAMSRPGFRHLQSPPHPHYYMKHEVLGLPPPLEFEEPQLGTADWSEGNNVCTRCGGGTSDLISHKCSSPGKEVTSSSTTDKEVIPCEKEKVAFDSCIEGNCSWKYAVSHHGEAKTDELKNNILSGCDELKNNILSGCERVSAPCDTSTTDQSGVPTTDRSGVSITDQSGVPTTDRSDVPTTDRSGVPTTDRSGVPTTDRSGVPTTVQTGNPKVTQPGVYRETQASCLNSTRNMQDQLSLVKESFQTLDIPQLLNVESGFIDVYSFRKYTIPETHEDDPVMFLNDYRSFFTEEMHSLFDSDNAKCSSLKINSAINIELKRHNVDRIEDVHTFNIELPFNIVNVEDIVDLWDDWTEAMIEEILIHLKDTEGSRFILCKIANFEIKYIKLWHKVTLGAYISYSTSLRGKQFIFNPEGVDNDICIIRAIAAYNCCNKSRIKWSNIPRSVETLNKCRNHATCGNLKLPHKISKLSNIERLNKISIYVYSLTEEGPKYYITLMRKGNQKFKQNLVPTLLLNNRHLVLIKDFDRYIKNILQKYKSKALKFCHTCFLPFQTSEQLNVHEDTCRIEQTIRVSSA